MSSVWSSAILLGIVNWFLLPSEIGNMYEQEGREKPVQRRHRVLEPHPAGRWFIWVVKVQNAMNRLYQ